MTKSYGSEATDRRRKKVEGRSAALNSIAQSYSLNDHLLWIRLS